MKMSNKYVKWAPALGLGALLSAVPLVAYAQDSDGDGVLDSVDGAPCDDSLAGFAFAPAENQFGLVLFEDQWPSQGDLDFNDVAVAYNYIYRLNGADQVVSLRLTLQTLALGGDFNNGLGVRLPVPRGEVASVTRQVGGGAIEPLVVSANDALLTVDISQNLREFFDDTQGPINSLPTLARRGSQEVVVEFTFATPQPHPLDVADFTLFEFAPYDLFIFRSYDRAHEIHLPDYAGTAAMNAALFGTQDDNSDLYRSFVDVQGLPFALTLPIGTVYPGEQVGIASLFPNIITFASSGGAEAQDFYVSSVNASAAYRDLAGLGALAPAALGFSADVSCAQVLVPAGSFVMGSPTNELGRLAYEGQAQVTLTRSFYLGATEVTQDQWTALSGGLNPSNWRDDGKLPIEQVTWWSALGYLNALSASQGLTACYVLPSSCSGSWQAGNLTCSGYPTISGSSVYACTGYRLPTEAEWEYAARAGTTTSTYNGNLTATNCSDTTTPSIGWFSCNSGGRPHPVAGRTPNAWGLYDMLGNVSEWMWDSTNRANPPGGTDPTLPSADHQPFMRGGSFTGSTYRASHRYAWDPANVRINSLGFRAARTAPVPVSCDAIKQANPASTDGVYSIDPDGAGGAAPFQAYCDMTRDGGGWTLVGRGRYWTAETSALSPGNTGRLPDSAMQSLRAVSTHLFVHRMGSRQIFVRDPAAQFVGGNNLWLTTASSVRCSIDYATTQGLNMAYVNTKNVSCVPNGVGSHNCGSNNGWLLLHSGDTFNYSGGHPCAQSGGRGPNENDANNELWLR